MIASFEARYAEAQAEAISYHRQLEAALRELDGAQLRVAELVEARAVLREQLEAQGAAAEEAAAEAAAEAARLQVGDYRWVCCSRLSGEKDGLQAVEL